MAGIFGEHINSRREFEEQLAIAQADCKKLCARLPDEPVLGAVGRQLDEVARWISESREPDEKDRTAIIMGPQIFREYESTDDVELYEFQQRIYVLHNYVRSWPTDAEAADDGKRDA